MEHAVFPKLENGKFRINMQIPRACALISPVCSSQGTTHTSFPEPHGINGRGVGPNAKYDVQRKISHLIQWFISFFTELNSKNSIASKKCRPQVRPHFFP
jgi:hypothetical protein